MYKVKLFVKFLMKLIVPPSMRPACRRIYEKIAAKHIMLQYMKLEYGKNLLDNLDTETIKKFEIKLKDYASKYEKLTFGIYYMRRIGEMSIIFHNFLSEYRQESKTLHIVFPIIFKDHGSGIVNQALYNKISEYMEIIDKDNFAFWLWVIKKGKGIKITYTDRFLFHKNRYDSMNYPHAEVTPKFSASEEAQAVKEMERMNLRRPFICIFNRDNAFYRSQNFSITDDKSIANVRNSSVKDMYLTVQNMKKNNIQCVRIGSVVEEGAD